MNYEIWGEACPAVTIRLNKGESIYTHEGGMSWMTEKMELSPIGGKGFFKTNSVFKSQFTALEDDQEVTLSATRAGKIKVFNITPDKPIVAQESIFLCAEPTVDGKTFQANISGSLYGQQGYMYQQYEGEGRVFVEIRGSLCEKTLLPGEKLIAESANTAAWEATVGHEVQFVRNSRSMLFKGKGTLITTLTGPGKVWLQTAPVLELAKRILPYLEER